MEEGGEIAGYGEETPVDEDGNCDGGATPDVEEHCECDLEGEGESKIPGALCKVQWIRVPCASRRRARSQIDIFS